MLPWVNDVPQTCDEEITQYNRPKLVVMWLQIELWGSFGSSPADSQVGEKCLLLNDLRLIGAYLNGTLLRIPNWYIMTCEVETSLFKSTLFLHWFVVYRK